MESLGAAYCLRVEKKGGQTLLSGREKPCSPEIRNLPVGGHETYHHALLGGVCTV
jgi:hypothetical protein